MRFGDWINHHSAGAGNENLVVGGMLTASSSGSGVIVKTFTTGTGSRGECTSQCQFIHFRVRGDKHKDSGTAWLLLVCNYVQEVDNEKWRAVNIIESWVWDPEILFGRLFKSSHLMQWVSRKSWIPNTGLDRVVELQWWLDAQHRSGDPKSEP